MLTVYHKEGMVLIEKIVTVQRLSNCYKRYIKRFYDRFVIWERREVWEKRWEDW